VLESQWKLLICVSDVPSAVVLTDLLASEGIATRVLTDAAVMGQAAPCRILVDPTQAYRARQILSREPLTDSELIFLATGELPEEEPDPGGGQAAPVS
jgi:hypothetical protein